MKNSYSILHLLILRLTIIYSANKKSVKAVLQQDNVLCVKRAFGISLVQQIIFTPITFTLPVKVSYTRNES